MNILTIYVNPNPRSFCHVILEQFSKGLKEAGNANEVVDLYGMQIDQVLSSQSTHSTPLESR